MQRLAHETVRAHGVQMHLGERRNLVEDRARMLGPKGVPLLGGKLACASLHGVERADRRDELTGRLIGCSGLLGQCRLGFDEASTHMRLIWSSR